MLDDKKFASPVKKINSENKQLLCFWDFKEGGRYIITKPTTNGLKLSHLVLHSDESIKFILNKLWFKKFVCRRLFYFLPISATRSKSASYTQCTNQSGKKHLQDAFNQIIQGPTSLSDEQDGEN